LKGAQFSYFELEKKTICLIAGHIFSLKSHRLPYDLDQLATMNILENRVQNKGGV
jgi:hypothetical protein